MSLYALHLLENHTFYAYKLPKEHGSLKVSGSESLQ